MTKKYLIILALVAASFLFVSSVSLAATTSTATSTATSTPKVIKDAGLKKFVTIWTAGQTANTKIIAKLQDVGNKMSSLSSLGATDYKGKLKIVNQAMTEVNAVLGLLNSQTAKLATLKKAAGTIKDKKIRAKAVLLANDIIAVYKPFKDMVQAEKSLLTLAKNALTLQSKGKTVPSNYMTKVTDLQKRITDDTTKMTDLGKAADTAQADFEQVTGITLTNK